MDVINLIGGRKFALALVIIAAGMAIDLGTARGVSQNLTALLLGVLGVFSASNVAVTMKGLAAQPSAPPTDDEAAGPAPSPDEATPGLREALIEMHAEDQMAAADIKQTLSQIASATALTNQAIAMAMQPRNNLPR